jgi:hypothetical protein
MKKLILFVVLLFSLTISAQEENTSVTKQFVETYTIGKSIDKDGNSSEWTDVGEVRIFFNYRNVSTSVRMYAETGVRDFRQIGATIKGITNSGVEYSLLELYNIVDGTIIKLAYYSDTRYGVMIAFEDGTGIQLSN